MQQHLVNRVNLQRESLSFVENPWQDRQRWRLNFSFDAEAAGRASIYFGYGGPTVSHADATPVEWNFAAGLHQTSPRSLSPSDELRRFARTHYLAAGDLRRLAVPAVPTTPTALPSPASSPELTSESALVTQPEPEPEPGMLANRDRGQYRSSTGFCTVVIHLECKDDDGQLQSQTTGLLVEVASASADPYGMRPPTIRQVVQTLLVGGRTFDMLDVYGLDSNVEILSPLSVPLRHRSLAESGIADMPHVDIADAQPSGLVDVCEGTISSEDMHAHAHGEIGWAVGAPARPEARYRITAGAEPGVCVICLCEAQDCVLLPCRHLCCCSGCAQALHDAALSGKPATAVAAAAAAAANELVLGQVAMLSVFSRQNNSALRLQQPQPPTPASPVCPVCRDSIEKVMQLSLPSQGKIVPVSFSKTTLESLAQAA